MGNLVQMPNDITHYHDQTFVSQHVQSDCRVSGIVVERIVCVVSYFQSGPVLVFCSLSRSVG